MEAAYSTKEVTLGIFEWRNIHLDEPKELTRKFCCCSCKNLNLHVYFLFKRSKSIDFQGINIQDADFKQNDSCIWLSPLIVD